MISITVPYPPSANVLWRRVGRRLIINHKAKDWKLLVSAQALNAGMRPTNGEMSVHLILHPRLTKAGKKSSVRLDLDNAIKPTLDALNGAAWLDDHQVTRIVAEVGDPIIGGGLTVIVPTMEK